MADAEWPWPRSSPARPGRVGTFCALRNAGLDQLPHQCRPKRAFRLKANCPFACVIGREVCFVDFDRASTCVEGAMPEPRTKTQEHTAAEPERRAERNG